MLKGELKIKKYEAHKGKWFSKSQLKVKICKTHRVQLQPGKRIYVPFPKTLLCFRKFQVHGEDGAKHVAKTESISPCALNIFSKNSSFRCIPKTSQSMSNRWRDDVARLWPVFSKMSFCSVTWIMHADSIYIFQDPSALQTPADWASFGKLSLWGLKYSAQWHPKQRGRIWGTHTHTHMHKGGKDSRRMFPCDDDECLCPVGASSSKLPL